MIDYSTFSFILISAFIIGSPGPTSLLVISAGLESFKLVYKVVFGVLVANAVWLTFSITGITISLMSLSAFKILQIVGCIYLSFLGIKSILSLKKISLSLTPQPKLGFATGFLTSITNPKAALFYISFLPQFVDQTKSLKIELFIHGLIYLSLVFLILSFYGLLSTKLKSYILIPLWSKILKIVIGICFILFGVKLLMLRF